MFMGSAALVKEQGCSLADVHQLAPRPDSVHNLMPRELGNRGHDSRHRLGRYHAALHGANIWCLTSLTL